MEAKFKSGDFVMPVLDVSGKTKMQIVEVFKQTCPAGIEQITYDCRLAIKYYHTFFELMKGLTRFNEIEVMAYVEPKEKV